MTNTGRTAAAMVLAWALLALAALLLSGPVYAAHPSPDMQASAQCTALEGAVDTCSAREHCCSRLSAQSLAVEAQGSRQLRVRPPLAVAPLATLYPPMHATASHRAHKVTPVFSFRSVYALTQRLRL